MYQLGDQYITITILVKICQFMRQIFAKPHEKAHEKNFTTLFLPLIDLQKKSFGISTNMFLSHNN